MDILILKRLRKIEKLIQIARRGFLKILIGMIYHEGVSKTQKKTLEEFNKDLKKINNQSGVL